MSAQHTPGPWTAVADDEDDGWVVVAGGKQNRVASVEPAFEPTLSRELANARLIAAAPELLALCKAVLAHPGFRQCDCGKPDCATTRLIAVIAKAEGAP